MPDLIKRGSKKLETPNEHGLYACPTCKRKLELRKKGLYCRTCAVTYHTIGGIPDFLVEKLENSSSYDIRAMAKWDSSFLLDTTARIYETFIYPPVCNVFGGLGSTSLKELARDVSNMMGSTNGVILDVACGPGTYGRRVASASRTVYGIDICMSMLRQGARYVERDNIPNVHFARAKVEALPFPAGVFDAAICAGSLNHFPDTLLALREINRTMKARATLVVMCFFVGKSGFFKHRRLREYSERRGGHIFELPVLRRYVAEAGFKEFHPHMYGSIIVFNTRKK